INANLTHYSTVIKKGEAHLWVLPETFATGFSSTDHTLAQKDGGEILSWMKKTALQCETAICGSAIIEENGKRFNRFYLVSADGEVQKYDKRHLFSYGHEEKYITAGAQRVLWTLYGWKIMPTVCYDLRFPVWSRNDTDYHMMLCVANWPDSRITAWDTLLKARAIENMAYVVGVNRVGVDSLGSLHTGHSVILTPLGKTLCLASEKEECVVESSVSMERVKNIRGKYGFLADRDVFDISI
ncbi:MAG: nitrilase family protein, partial [Flavobacteriales bacterium]|nr:nitrilase family protein [Flavobacteriales bacterium]